MKKFIVIYILISLSFIIKAQETVGKFKYKKNLKRDSFKKCSIVIYSDSTYVFSGKMNKSTTKTKQKKGIRTNGYFELKDNYSIKKGKYIFYQNKEILPIVMKKKNVIEYNGMKFYCAKCD